MTLTITPQGLMYTLIVILLITITYFLIRTLMNLNKLLGNINSLIEENKKNIDESLTNVNLITNSAKNKMEYIDKFIAPSEQAAENDGVDIVTIVASLIDLINELKSIWTAKRKKRR